MNETYEFQFDHEITLGVEVFSAHDTEPCIWVMEQYGGDGLKIPLSEVEVVLCGDEMDLHDVSRARLVLALEALIERVRQDDRIIRI